MNIYLIVLYIITPSAVKLAKLFLSSEVASQLTCTPNQLDHIAEIIRVQINS